MTLRDRIQALIAAESGLTDREITDRVLARDAPQQSVNAVANALARAGLIVRRPRADGKIGNYSQGAQDTEPRPETCQQAVAPFDSLSEDELKRKLGCWLRDNGWEVDTAWGKTKGIDLEARNGTRRWVIEVKGSGSLNPMRVNYFLAILGELLQRMSDPNARYSIALPDMAQFRGLWNRLPLLAKSRTQISALFVTEGGGVEEVQ